MTSIHFTPSIPRHPALKLAEGPPFPLQDVREHGNYQYIRFVDPVHQVQIDTSGENSLMNLGNMKVVDVYDEVFLAVHPLHIEELVSGSSGSSQTNKSELKAVF